MDIVVDKLNIYTDIENNYDEYFESIVDVLDDFKVNVEDGIHVNCNNVEDKLYSIRLDEFKSFKDNINKVDVCVLRPFERRPFRYKLILSQDDSNKDLTYKRGYSDTNNSARGSDLKGYETRDRYKYVLPDDDISYNNSELPYITVNSGEWNREFSWTQLVHDINRNVFKNESFRPNQLGVINCILSGYDTFVIIPTGGGKSLCFQLPAVIDGYLGRNCLTVVVMPLVALIRDQMKRLNDLGIGCRALVGELSWIEKMNIYDDILETTENVNILFVTPERLTSSKLLLDSFKKLDRAGRLSRFVIDEAHCVSQWGNDFRPDYGEMGLLKSVFPNINVCAFTATATESVIVDVIKKLRLKDPIIFKSDFNRMNLRYEVIKKDKQAKKSLELLIKLLTGRFMNQCGIIYCLSCKESEDVSKAISHYVSACYYHAQMTMNKRNRVYHDWMDGRIKVIVATLAFGMGIDKKDVRFVIHYSMPKSLENYFQESGRAGRDGNHSTCIILYEYHDMQRLLSLTQSSYNNTSTTSTNTSSSSPSENTHLINSRRNILKMMNYCEDNLTCRRVTLLNYFGQKFQSECNIPCDICSSTDNIKFIYKNCQPYASFICESLLYTPRNKTFNFTILTLHKLLLSKNNTSQPLCGYLRKNNFTPNTAMVLLKQMIIHELLIERVVKIDTLAFPLFYIKANSQYRSLSHYLSNLKIPIDENTNQTKEKKKYPRKKKDTNDGSKPSSSSKKSTERTSTRSKAKTTPKERSKKKSPKATVNEKQSDENKKTTRKRKTTKRTNKSPRSKASSTEGNTDANTPSVSLADSSPNYLSLKSRATPGDRGEVEDLTSSGIPGSDLRELEGEVNKGGATPGRRTPRGTPRRKVQSTLVDDYTVDIIINRRNINRIIDDDVIKKRKHTTNVKKLTKSTKGVRVNIKNSSNCMEI